MMVQYWKKAYRVDSTKGRLGGLELLGESDIIGVIRDSRLRWTGWAHTEAKHRENN